MNRQPTFTGGVDGDVPAGFHRLSRSRAVGTGAEDFRRAAEVLLRWRMLRRAGLRIEATVGRAEVGATVLQQFGPMSAPCRIVWVLDEPRRAGFRYASLPGHPEQGAEQFVVEHRADDSVWGQITSVSRAAAWYARLGGPVTRIVQATMVGRYLKCLVD